MPVRGGTAAVEQPGRGEDECPGAPAEKCGRRFRPSSSGLPVLEVRASGGVGLKVAVET
jgi:hypothetical protein